MIPILTAKVGDNADLFPDILQLYAKPYGKIADVTFGKGAFWKKIDVSQYDFFPSDISTGVDYNALPYKDDSFDALILDPPYMGHNGGKDYQTARNYKVDVKRYDPMYIENLYRGGIREAKRVLIKNGILIIKCQDEIQSGKQNLNHCKIIDFCIEDKFIVEDLFIMVRKGIPVMRHKHQLHARKNHSYFLVLKK